MPSSDNRCIARKCQISGITSVMSRSSSFLSVSCRSSSCLLSLTLLILSANWWIVFSAWRSCSWSGCFAGVLSSIRWISHPAKRHYLTSPTRWLVCCWQRDITSLTRSVGQNSNTVIGTLAVDGRAVRFGTARRGLGAAAPPSPLLAVPNVTAHPSTPSVPTLYYLM